jgi:hypothetical protein
VAAYIAAKFSAHLARLARPGYRLGLRDFYSGNFSLRRETLAEVGLFDEGFKSYGNEDLELAYRLAAAGVALSFAPEALAHQHYEKDFPALARDTLAKGRTAVLLARKQPAAAPGLKLGEWLELPPGQRRLRRGLLAAGSRWGGIPRVVVRLVTLLERCRAPRLAFVYARALDYFFWLGAAEELGGSAALPAGLERLLRAADENNRLLYR